MTPAEKSRVSPATRSSPTGRLTTATCRGRCSRAHDCARLLHVTSQSAVPSSSIATPGCTSGSAPARCGRRVSVPMNAGNCCSPVPRSARHVRRPRVPQRERRWWHLTPVSSSPLRRMRSETPAARPMLKTSRPTSLGVYDRHACSQARAGLRGRGLCGVDSAAPHDLRALRQDRRTGRHGSRCAAAASGRRHLTSRRAASVHRLDWHAAARRQRTRVHAVPRHASRRPCGRCAAGGSRGPRGPIRAGAPGLRLRDRRRRRPRRVHAARRTATPALLGRRPVHARRRAADGSGRQRPVVHRGSRRSGTACSESLAGAAADAQRPAMAAASVSRSRSRCYRRSTRRCSIGREDEQARPGSAASNTFERRTRHGAVDGRRGGAREDGARPVPAAGRVAAATSMCLSGGAGSVEIAVRLCGLAAGVCGTCWKACASSVCCLARRSVERSSAHIRHPQLAPLSTRWCPDSSKRRRSCRACPGRRAPTRHRACSAKSSPSHATSRFVLVLEDCHWMDSASWRLVLRVAQDYPQALIVLTSRPAADVQELSALRTARTVRRDEARAVATGRDRVARRERARRTRRPTRSWSTRSPSVRSATRCSRANTRCCWPPTSHNATSDATPRLQPVAGTSEPCR